MRKIPATMASQHPDHGAKPFWHDHEFINTHAEITEAFINFSELGIAEYKWDWEGKLVDESVLERIWGQYYDYFKKNQIGKETFLTFRLPNPKVETEFRLGRAFMGLLSAAGLAAQVGLHSPPLFEVILPMTETAEEIIDIQSAFAELSSLKHKLLRADAHSLKHIQVIPLFESTDTIVRSADILREYVEGHRWLFKSTPQYLRPYVARSDPALNAGIVPTVLAIKIALSRYKQFEEQYGIPLYPVIGSASLPFRGGLTPYSVKEFAREYQGIRTALIQSAFRYDYPKEDVISALSQLSTILPAQTAQLIPVKDEQKLLEIMAIFEKHYRSTIEEIADLINHVAARLPKRRERVQHVGLFGYSRGVGKVKLPRAIGFTGALYTLGVPPELIGTGRALAEIQKKGLLPLLKKYYVRLNEDLTRAGRFFHAENFALLSRKSPVWKHIQKDIPAIEQVLKIDISPQTDAEREHNELIGSFFPDLLEGSVSLESLTRAAVLRKSMG